VLYSGRLNSKNSLNKKIPYLKSTFYTKNINLENKREGNPI